MPKLILLRTFESAARMESFTLAAQELCLTQSAISHQIKELEAHFGRALFLRRNRRVELTVEGKRLLDSLARVFDVIEAVCNEVSLAPQAQVLALYCAPSFAVNWLGPRLPEFLQAHPDITIRLTSGSEQLDLNRAQELDVVISYNPVPTRVGIVSLGLGPEQIAPLCSPALQRPGRPAREIIRELVLIDSQLNRVSWSQWFALNGLKLPNRPRPSFDRALLAISAAVNGTGVCLESTRLAEREIQRGDLVVLGQGEFASLAQETHFLSYRASEQRLAKVRIFRDWLLGKVGLGEGSPPAP